MRSCLLGLHHYCQYSILSSAEKGEIRIWKHGCFEHCIHFKAHEGRVKVMRVVRAGEIDCLVTAEANGEISVWDILEFLRGVEALSQDYPLEGLKPLSSVRIKQRIICLEAISM
jgi:WD40 repeat protein